MKYTKEQINEMREKLAELTLDISDSSTFYDVLMEGCRGYNNIDDSEIVEEFENAFGDDYFEDTD